MPVKKPEKGLCYESMLHNADAAMSLFGSSGIRGVVGEVVTPDLALSIGATVGSLHSEVLMAKDTRTSGDMILHALASGANSTGANVFFAGMVPTPTLARASKTYDCGLMVTASHNPPEYNGVKMWNPDGSAFDSRQMEQVENLITSKKFKMAEWSSIGRSFPHEGAVEDHIQAVLDSVYGSSAKVILDCACGATSVVSPILLRKLGCAVLGINCQPDGFFPGRMPEPTEEHLADLKELIVKKGASLGIAHDGDGDRVVAFDEKGRFVDGDRLLALFTLFIKAKNVVVPVDASMVLDDLVKGKVTRTKVGDVYVAEALKRTGADFGGEPSGTFIFPSETYCPDGVYAAALLASMLEGRKLSELVGSIPKYPLARRSFPFKAKDQAKISSKLDEAMRSVDCDRLDTMDGYRAQFADGWFLARLSGTEPKVRITVEARRSDSLDKLLKLAEGTIKRCLS